MKDTVASSSFTKKRPRSNHDEDILSNLSQWITSTQQRQQQQQGEAPSGFCHEAVRWRADTRELTVSRDIDSDTLLFFIPASCIVKPQNCTVEKVSKQPLEQKHLHHGLDDVLIAWYLATRPPSLEAYISSLPMIDIANALPRRWPKDLLHHVLHGSPVLENVEAQKRGVVQDYRILHAILSDGKDEKPPSLEAFDQAMAVVSSRAFAGTMEGSACLIPLLDLCNHQRGGGGGGGGGTNEGAGRQTKNLRYAWDDHGNMVVHAARTIGQDNDILRITYGAQSNGQLLVNYGFCIPDNLEPDGSSNNVYEFKPVPSSSTIILLRMGPKSYTYGPLVQAVEALGTPEAYRQGIAAVANSDEDEQILDVNDGGPDDMEAFLNGCEDDEDDNDDDNEGPYCGNDCMYTRHFDIDAQEDDGAIDSAMKQQKRSDLLALESFYERLASLLQSYDMDTETPSAPVLNTAAATTTKLQYAKLLVESEQEILRFYQVMVAELLSKLDTTSGKTWIAPISMSETQREQIQSLVDAFFQIRYTML